MRLNAGTLPPSPLGAFHPAVAEWFQRELGLPTPCQSQAWLSIADGKNTLIAAPTGSGKTLAAFLSAINNLVVDGLQAPLPDTTRVLYVSPLKALSNDIQRNLERPLMGISDCLNELGKPSVPIRTMVRTGDTPQSARNAMRRHAPHILVTTPESLYILLTSDSGRRILSTVRTVIIDEIHAIANSKRGAHLTISLERLQALAGGPQQRIGLSATQNPVETVAHFLVGQQDAQAHTPRPCHIIDVGHERERDLALEVPDSALEAIMSGEVWQEVFSRLVQLIEQHRTTLVFVNTRRLAERVAHALTEHLGEAHVTSHHGSLAREQRFDAEQRLKHGKLKALVATASLELGIDIGDVDLVCQLGSPRSIATFLQRVGRSGHAVTGIPKGRLFPLSRDDLLECTALLLAVKKGELDRLIIPQAPIDVLAQHLVAMAGAQPWNEDQLFQCVRSAYSYRNLSREQFTSCLRMLAEGYATRRGRRGAFLHRDAVNGHVRARRGARLTAITNGGAIPDNADFNVVLEPDGLVIGTLNEDFAIESMPGDIFLLGNAPWRILRVENQSVRVEDASGLPPTIPFWFGEAPGRTDELSRAVSVLNQQIVQWLQNEHTNDLETAYNTATRALMTSPGISRQAAEQLIDYLGASLRILGALPSHRQIILERFFDDSGGMQLVIHSCLGSRINKAWGLALRKRFCRTFNFELQAAANESSIVISLGETHSFPLADAARYVRANTARDVLTQALLDAPVFDVRWRWNANISLAVPRFSNGRKVPPPLQRMQAEDLVAVAFPDQIACAENLSGPRQIPDHPLVQQTIHDALTEAMDIEGLQRLLTGIESGEIQILARDLTEPSPLASEILVANPYAYLDDAPAEERRTRAVRTRRHVDHDDESGIGRISADAIRSICESLSPHMINADELHDALVLAGTLTTEELEHIAPSDNLSLWLSDLQAARRATEATINTDSGLRTFVVAAERWQEFSSVYPYANPSHPIATPSEYQRAQLSRDEAVVELVRARVQITGPFDASSMAQALSLPAADIELALIYLETQGVVLRGEFTAPDQWCERRILARIHRASIRTERAMTKPVSRSVYLQFLFDWQYLSDETRLSGSQALDRILERLAGASAPAQSWESEILPSRSSDFDPTWLDHLCLAGKASWLRLSVDTQIAVQTTRRQTPLRRAPIALMARHDMELWMRSPRPNVTHSLTAGSVLERLDRDGALFFDQLLDVVDGSTQTLEQVLSELAALGLVTSDGFAGLRALIRRKSRTPTQRWTPSPFSAAGRWSRLSPPTWPSEPDRSRLKELEYAERFARVLLARYGIVFKAVTAREHTVAPWRDIIRALRRLEARGEIRGGRFVEGFAGEQFALPEAAESLTLRARRPTDGSLVSIAGADPMNLTGVIASKDRIAARPAVRIVFRDGVPIAQRSGQHFTALCELSPDEQWTVRALLFANNNRHASLSPAQMQVSLVASH